MTQISSALLLRLGLAFTLIYAAISGFIEPDAWIGFFPEWLRAIIPAYPLLTAFGIFEIIVALFLLFDKYTRWFAYVYAVIMAGIVIFNPGAFIITFRDVGLAFAAISLALMSKKIT